MRFLFFKVIIENTLYAIKMTLFLLISFKSGKLAFFVIKYYIINMDGDEISCHNSI